MTESAAFHTDVGQIVLDLKDLVLKVIDSLLSDNGTPTPVVVPLSLIVLVCFDNLLLLNHLWLGLAQLVLQLLTPLQRLL